MRERTRLWKLPKVDGGTREIDISELVCPMVNAENLSELFKVNDENVDHMAGNPPGSQLWAIEGDVTGPFEVSTLAVNLGPGERCVVHFRLML